jgi:predicted nuclease of predicted toxin-antitoxin system
MKFIIDAQLPKVLADFLSKKGHNTLHTLELPDKNKTTDKQILEIAVEENYILVTKDLDFLESFYLNQQPSKLILVKTGNISNEKLLEIFSLHISMIEKILLENSFIEIFRDEIIIHSDKI